MTAANKGGEVMDAPLRKLEALLGNPWDVANPCGFQAVLDADERGEMLAEGERVLDRFGLGGAFVPVSLGGRLHDLTHLIDVGRALFRRDPCLGLGHGASSLIAAVNVWASGSKAQQVKVADLLLSNRKIACAYHELDHGNDLMRADFEAVQRIGEWVLNGGKQVIANVERADALVLFARTDPTAGSRSHSLLLVDKAALPAERVSHSPRFASMGMRGVPLGGIRLHDCAVSPDCVLGSAGSGLETALKAFQVTRVALPGMFMGILDTGLRLTLRHASQRVLYGRGVLDLPLTQALLVNAFADLLLCDCLVTVAARSLHLTPGAGIVYSAAVKYLIPKLLIDAMTSLSSVLGAQFYMRRGTHGVFQKLLRDLRPASFGHASRASCQMTILPQLPPLARRAWTRPDALPVPAALFDVDVALAPFAFDAITLGAGKHDPLISALIATSSALSAQRTHSELAALTKGFVDSVGPLQQNCAGLPPSEVGVMASVQSHSHVGRYVTLLAASACLNLWWHEHAKPAQHGDAFLRDSRWLELVLQRLQCRLNNATPATSTKHCTHMLAELRHRHEHGQSFDLRRRDLSG